MPPKTAITRERIICAATELVRMSGAEALNARALAKAIGCSTQPLFYQFESMNEIKNAVLQEAKRVYEGYLTREMERRDFPKYKLSGLGYIRFAREEKELFKLLFMRERENGSVPEEDAVTDEIVLKMSEITGLTLESAKKMHGVMWAFVHGIAAMAATNYLFLDESMISDMMTKVYRGLLSEYGKEDKNDQN